ncbi:uncharacterized protein LOC100904270 [Galendromus occidentalis]|uniref:RNA-directed DNA polymerase n=1 Tax=Galendromus occidentalis TaxID=34638 RepID=A0AAJ6VXJ3_9ACAR|nr:uncharacterized protein LOC100904270 [Galendromus occidentalis]
MLKISHSSYHGDRLLWRRARDCIFWPGLKQQLGDFCNNCEACLSFRSKQRKQPMIETTSATYPFRVVFRDLFELRKLRYLVTVDVFSDFFEVDNLGETASTKKYLAQGNGKAEAAVKIAERLLKKCTKSEEDYEYGFLETRNVSHPEGSMTVEMFKIFLAINYASGSAFKGLRSVMLKAVDDKPQLTVTQLREVVVSYDKRTRDSTIDPSDSVVESSAAVNKVQLADRQKRLYSKPSGQSATKKQYAATTTTCSGCGGSHNRRSCRFSGATCFFCHKKGHLKKVCSNFLEKQSSDAINPGTVDVSEVSDSDRSRAIVSVFLNGVTVRLRVDTGADLSVIGKALRGKIGSPRLLPMISKRTAANGEGLDISGFFTADYKLSEDSDFVVSDRVIVLRRREAALLGCRPIFQLGLLVPNQSLEICSTVEGSNDSSKWRSRYPDVFKEGLGLRSKVRVRLDLKEESRPVHLRARPIAAAFRDAVDKELDRLLDLGVLSAVESSSWACPIVVARKANGKIRVCADYSTGLNDALQDVSQPIPNMEEMMTKFSGNRVSTQLDSYDAYLQLELEAPSRALTTINTHRGLFQYNRLVSGLKTAPAVFQRAMDQALTGLDGTLVYLDDILVEYLGVIVNEQGIKADPQKISAIQNLRRPGNVSEGLIEAADACNTGIGGVLLQRYPDGVERAVFHASKSLTSTQRNYSRIEKEAPALVYTVERLEKFVWGRHFILQTDHRPLLA